MGLLPSADVDRLTDQDAQILSLESGAIRGHTCKLVIIEPRDPALGVEELRAHIATRLDRAPRLRRRLAPTPLRIANPTWVDDPAFHISEHVRAVPGTERVSDEALRGIVARLMAERLDRDRPLWRLDVVEEMEDGSTALIWRIHHCMADGATVVKLGSALLWDEDPEAADPQPAPWQPQRGHTWVEQLALGVGHRLRRGRRTRGEKTPLRQELPVVRRELGRTAASSPFDRRIGAARSVAFASAPFADLKKIEKAFGEHITLNDVVLAMVAGAVREWLEQHHAPEEGIRVQVPVSLHHHDPQAAAEANRDSYFFVDLPVAEPDPVARLRAINSETADRKQHHDAETLYALGLHPSVARWAMSPHVFTFNVSNVPGPHAPVFVRGARVREMYSLAEVAQHHALRVAVISAAGTMFFAFCADRDAVAGLDMLAAGIDQSLAELLARV